MELDHGSPGRDHQGFQVISRSLNRVKGSVLDVLLEDLVAQPTWSGLMERWTALTFPDPA